MEIKLTSENGIQFLYNNKKIKCYDHGTMICSIKSDIIRVEHFINKISLKRMKSIFEEKCDLRFIAICGGGKTALKGNGVEGYIINNFETEYLSSVNDHNIWLVVIDEINDIIIEKININMIHYKFDKRVSFKYVNNDKLRYIEPTLTYTLDGIDEIDGMDKSEIKIINDFTNILIDERVLNIIMKGNLILTKQWKDGTIHYHDDDELCEYLELLGSDQSLIKKTLNYNCSFKYWHLIKDNELLKNKVEINYLIKIFSEKDLLLALQLFWKQKVDPNWSIRLYLFFDQEALYEKYKRYVCGEKIKFLLETEFKLNLIEDSTKNLIPSLKYIIYIPKITSVNFKNTYTKYLLYKHYFQDKEEKKNFLITDKISYILRYDHDHTFNEDFIHSHRHIHIDQQSIHY